MTGQPGAERSGEESPAAVKGAGRAFGRQTGREDEPESRQRHTVARHVFRRAAQAHRPRTEAFGPCQRHAREDEQQQQVHRKVECRLVLQPRGEVFEKDMPLQRHVAEAEVGDRLDPPHGDQQEPPEGQRHVHVAQQRIDAENPAVQQRLAHHLPHGLRRAARGQAAHDAHLVCPGQTPKPHAPLPREGKEHHGRTDHERNAERREKGHRQKSPSLRFINSTTPRVLMPRGHTSRHLPHSMHLFISS